MAQLRFLIALSLVIGACHTVSGAEDSLAIRALLDLTWADPPKDIDLIVVQQRIGRPLNREAERAFLDRTFASFPDSHPMKKLQKNNPEGYRTSIESTIDEAVIRKESPQLFRYRYSVDRWGDNPPRFRRDRLKHRGDDISGNSIESLEPVDSWVNVGDLVDGHYESLEYERGANRLDRYLDSDKPKWSTNDLWRLWGPGGGVWLLLRNSCGTVASGSKVASRDPSKEELLLAGAHGLVLANQSIVDLNGKPAYLIKLFVKESPDHPVFKVWSDASLPVNVFRFESFDPKTGKLTSRCEMNDRDSNGLVHHWKEEKVENGNRVQLDEFRILRVIDPAETEKSVFREGAFERTFTLTHYPDRIVTAGPNGRVVSQPKKTANGATSWRVWLVGVNMLVVLAVLRSIIRRRNTTLTERGNRAEEER